MRITTYRVEALQGPHGVDASTVDLGPAGQLGVGAAWARVAPGLGSVANQHDEIETWVIVAGEGEVFADADRRRVSASTVVQFEPFETHFVEN
ncbi:MAG TPA: methionine--tRNA ligase, partial [Candidatus Eisenbacteria bacterium]|nr:methionine--tRNA ligase [Candidatus Eisenbacteria bacterium]